MTLNFFMGFTADTAGPPPTPNWIEKMMGIGEGWTCKGAALERNIERTAGLGDNIRTERVQEKLSKAGSELVYGETVTVIDPAGGKPKHTEVKFAAVK